MIYTINNCIRAFGYTNFDNLIADMGSVDNLKAYVRANGYADIAVAEDTELLLVDVNGKTWHTGCYGAQLGPEPEYLCFTSTGDSTVRMDQKGTPDTSANKVIQYKLNDGEWQTWDLSAISLTDGDKMYIKADDEIPISESEEIHKEFVMTGSIAASGNIMSLLNFSDTLNNYAFYGLFKNCSTLTQAPELPTTTLSDHCYSYMFAYCSSLTSAPELPATTLERYCYSAMFRACTTLTQAPELFATTLTDGCYNMMFIDCKSLKTTPHIHAATTAYRCCYSMFYGCTSLTTALELPATTLTESCYYLMFRDCTALTQAPTLPATTLAVDCYDQMFYGCTSLTTAPELPATTLSEGCYASMFANCVKLNYVKAMFTTTPSSNYTLNWLYNVSPTGTFIKSKDATWDNTAAGIPTGWTVQVEGGVTPEPEPERDYLCFTSTGDSTVAIEQYGTPTDISNGKVIQYKLNDGQWQTWDLSAVTLHDGDKMYLKSDDEIPISESTNIFKQFAMTGSIAASGNIMSLLNFSTTLTDHAFYNLFSYCASLTTAPELPATTLGESCYNYIFYECTSLRQAPALPATTLVKNCYAAMFYLCTSLASAPELPATELAERCYISMFGYCERLNYVKAMFTTDPSTGSYLSSWLSGVSETGTFVKNAAATWTNEQAGIPSGWTVQTASPDK